MKEIKYVVTIITHTCVFLLISTTPIKHNKKKKRKKIVLLVNLFFIYIALH